MATAPGFGFPQPPGIPPYPGTPQLNGLPGLQYNPVFDGTFSHGLTTNPYDNSLFEDLNTMQSMIYGQGGLGFPALGGFPQPSTTGTINNIEAPVNGVNQTA